MLLPDLFDYLLEASQDKTLAELKAQDVVKLSKIAMIVLNSAGILPENLS